MKQEGKEKWRDVKRCEECNNEYTPKRYDQKYCSKDCRLIVEKNAYVSIIDKTPRKCMVCNKEYIPKATNQKYCSRECRLIVEKNADVRPGREWDKTPRKCIQCNKEYTPKAPNNIYCGPECSKVYTKVYQHQVYRADNPEWDKTPRKCEECNSEYTPKQPSQKYCTKDCRSIVAKNNKNEIAKPKHSKKLFKTKNTGYISHFDSLNFNNEEEFHHWFEENFSLFGFKKLHKSNPMFPDIIAETYDDKVMRVELEYNASNFTEHDHDRNMCDIVISFVKYKGVTHIKGLPLISIFEMLPTRQFRRYNGEANTADRKLTDYFVSVVNALSNNFNCFRKEDVYWDNVELAPYLQQYKNLGEGKENAI